MIVAPRTADGQAEKGGGGRRKDVIQVVGPLLQLPFDILDAHDVVRAADQEPRGGVCAGLITCQLLEDELRVRLVVVKGDDDIIAIRPRRSARFVRLVAVGLAEAHHVQPMPPQRSP